MKTRTTIAILIILILIIAFVAWTRAGMAPNQGAPASNQPISTAMYACDAGKTIQASFYEGTTTLPTTPNQPPIPGGSAHIILSDGRTLDLKQTISADGVRYATADESIVFWTKGNGAFIQENGQTSYSNCVQSSNDPGGLPQTYTDSAAGFSIRYPAGYAVDDSYAYQALGPGKDIRGVKFTIPASMATGTNLSDDSYVSVEEMPSASYCSADLFVSSGSKVSTSTDNGVTYSVATSADAGAGNRYDETVYAIPGTKPCIAVRYFIHYGAFENYPAGTVTQFDEKGLMSSFDAIRRTLVVSSQI